MACWAGQGQWPWRLLVGQFTQWMEDIEAPAHPVMLQHCELGTQKIEPLILPRCVCFTAG